MTWMQCLHTRQKAGGAQRRQIGVTALALKKAIFIYILGWQIVYKGLHLQISEVDGVRSVTVQQHVEHCNPDNSSCHDNYTAYDQLP